VILHCAGKWGVFGFVQKTIETLAAFVWVSLFPLTENTSMYGFLGLGCHFSSEHVTLTVQVPLPVAVAADDGRLVALPVQPAICVPPSLAVASDNGRLIFLSVQLAVNVPWCAYNPRPP
jgi:hypothetical protein